LRKSHWGIRGGRKKTTRGVFVPSKNMRKKESIVMKVVGMKKEPQKQKEKTGPLRRGKRIGGRVGCSPSHNGKEEGQSRHPIFDNQGGWGNQRNPNNNHHPLHRRASGEKKRTRNKGQN